MEPQVVRSLQHVPYTSIRTTSTHHLAHSPIVISALTSLLKNYPHKEDAEILKQGFIEGFRLGYTGKLQHRQAPNLPSLLNNMQAARDIIHEELAAGRIAGPFTNPPIPALRFSPIGLVPKSSGKFRLIHHLSWPLGDSVNDGISDDAARVQYTSFDQVIENIARLGPGTLLAKADVKSAFRLLPVHPADQPLLGFTFDGCMYYDLCLPFGARSSCAQWERFAKFLNWCVSQNCSSGGALHHYLDDFICLGKSSTTCCQSTLNGLVELCRQLGVPLAKDKMEGPSTVLTFLGLTIDTTRMEIRLPTNKVQKAFTLVQSLITRKRIKLRMLQSIIGSLNFICRVIPAGRAFLQRLITLTRGVRKRFYSVRISRGAKLDAAMWQRFLVQFNGTTAFLPITWQDSTTLQFYSDASRTRGYGAYFAGRWFCGHWPTPNHKWSIAVCELFPIVLGVITWAAQMRQQKVLIFCDNRAVTQIINKQTSHCPRIMTLIRALTLECLRRNILIRAMHVMSKCNKVTDSLSRGRMDLFRVLAPEAEDLPTPTPEAHALLCALKSSG